MDLTLPRRVDAEALDNLPAQDPRALRARRDLHRVHRAMGTRSTLLQALRRLSVRRTITAASAPLRVLELGAGDGSLMLGVAQAMHSRWPAVALTLLDRQALLAPATAAAYTACGWTATQQLCDVRDWAAEGDLPAAPSPALQIPHWDLVVANLFLHHFEHLELAAVLAAVARRTDDFFACEPRRGWLAWAGSHLVGALGANAVTRADAVLSVHAGFRAAELRALWPASARGWTLSEYPAGLFSHCLLASRARGTPDGGV